MPQSPQSDLTPLKTGWRCKCPACGQGNLYQTPWSMNVRDRCPVCSLNLGANDSADGPAVILVFVLGLILVPLALISDAVFTIPLWAHIIIWSIVTVGLTLICLRRVKAFVVALQFKHLPWAGMYDPAPDTQDHDDHDKP